MTVLVTGASGSVGRFCLARLVQAGWRVLALSRRAQQGQRDGVRWLRYDLLELDAGMGDLLREVAPTHVLHLAWDTKRNTYWNSSENLSWLRVSTHLLELCLEAGVERVVGVGTGAEYRAGALACDEKCTPLGGESPYAMCKAALSKVFEACQDKFPQGTAWARLFFPYGPHDHPDKLFPYITRQIQANLPAQVSSGEQVRDFLYADDVASALVALLSHSLKGPINLASGQGVALREAMLELANLLGKPELLEFGQRSQRSEEADVWVARVDRLHHELGWTPGYSLQQGLASTVSGFGAGIRQEPL